MDSHKSCGNTITYLENKAERFWGYVKVLMDKDNDGEIHCADCGTELSLGQLEDNYEDPLCSDCVRALKN